MKNTVILIVAGGFYFFGEQVDAPEGYVALRSGAMFGGFAGGKGVAGVATGNKESTVKLDRFEKSRDLMFPLSAVYGILPSINLYEFKGAEIRNP